MPTNYPSGYDTETSGSLGVDKANKDPIVSPSLNDDANEYNTVKQAVRQLELKVGDGASVLTRYGDSDSSNVREGLDYLVHCADRAGYHDHLASGLTAINAIAGGGAATIVQRTGGIGVSEQTCNNGNDTGLQTLSTVVDLFLFQSTYTRFRWQIDTAAFGPWATGDYIRCGLWRDASNYVMFESIVDGVPSWPNWTVEINDGGSTDSTTLSTGPDTSWHVFEILTTASGAYFYIDRNTASEEYAYLSGQAPDTGYCDQRVWANCADATGAKLYVDAMSCQDTRIL